MGSSAEALAKDIRDKRGTGAVSKSTLHVDDRVLARVTDGIYRRPSSAFRELISNAYDADATAVTIHTDAPRFERVVIRDNGIGMSPETVADLVNHIGGSSKRTARGKRLETVNSADPSLSPAGRRLIGKIGIGLFSVAQLTQHFQVITKRRGDNYRTAADIILKTHTEEFLKDAPEEEAAFETGEVAITSEPADDLEAHGTEIILMDLRPQAKELLRSSERWAATEPNEDGEAAAVDPPSFHIGRSRAGDPDVYELPPKLPWEAGDLPEARFRKLYHAVRDEVRSRQATPNIEDSLDSYLGMLWTLSLAIPVRYVDKHPFDLTADDGIGFYRLNTGKGGAEAIELAAGQSIGEALGLVSAQDPLGRFSVVVDDVELLRPIAFDRSLHGNSGIGQPLMFFGSVKSKLGSLPANLGGGDLAFEAYFYWNQKITPKENNGCLVRVNNASGVLFDKTFLDYQVSELTRLRQLMSEVFITDGLDAALNIDRESFNFSHPHYQYLQKWVHYAVRQTTNRLKSLSKDLLAQKKEEAAAARLSAVEGHVETVWRRRRGEGSEPPPTVTLVSSGQQSLALSGRERGEIVVDAELVLPKASGQSSASMSAQVAALAQVLAAYGLLDDLSYSEQDALLADIAAVFAVS